MPTKKMSVQRLAFLFIIAGVIGLAASLLLTIDKMKLLQNPGYIPPCNISPFISCGSVMKTGQAAVLGFPNSLIGLAFFAMITTVGFALAAGATMKKWFWLGVQALTALSALFVYWLAYQSIFVIGSLCPYCIVVWSVTLPLALYVKLHNMRAGYLGVSEKCATWASRYHWVWLAIAYLIIVVPIAVRFWWYWMSFFI